MRCPEFEALLTEALDGLLPATQQPRFQAHRTACPFCGPMLAEAELGRSLLRSLEEVAPPPELVLQILAATVGAAARKGPVQQPSSPWGRIRSWMGEAGSIGRDSLAAMAQPRFAMSFAMVFFSIAMLLNISGLHVCDVRRIDLRPATFVRTYEQASGKLERYYENIRIVYEIQSRVEEFRQSTRETEPPPSNNKTEPSRPTGGLERGGSSYAQQAWLQDLASEPILQMEQSPVQARMEPAAKTGARGSTTSDSPGRSTYE